MEILEKCLDGQGDLIIKCWSATAKTFFAEMLYAVKEIEKNLLERKLGINQASYSK